MMAPSWRLGLASMVAAAWMLPAALRAQGSRTCDVVVDSTLGVGRKVDIGQGRFRFYAGGGVWAHCKGQITKMHSDSVAWYPEFDRFDMVGGVTFRDSAVNLNSQRATYVLNQERLDAYGNAVLRNLVTGSVLTGPTITYLRRAQGVRDSAELIAPNRPTVRYLAVGDTAGAPPWVITSDRLRLVGNTEAWAGGNVRIRREDFDAHSDSARLNVDAGGGRLVGHARVEGSGGGTQPDAAGYTLTGRNIDFKIDGKKLTWVQAEDSSLATSADWRLSADTIAFDIENDQVQGGEAWGDSLTSTASSVGQTITADSLVIAAPDQQLTEVRGIGAARAVAKRDSTDADPDWVVGDTVIARFDSTGGGRRGLVGLAALGKAGARYRVYEADQPTKLAGIDYSRGDRITAHFTGAAIERVDVAGNADGVYLQVPATTADSTAPKAPAADSVATPRPGTGGGG
ncbi:MAG TPA: hypothetical protein VJ992_07640 [Gemmatimonadales bacterium]|nr:hypothetical protein [Gemmatimonadales bacterium]